MGVFEISEDLVGYEYLCCMIAEEPGLVAEIYRRIGSLMLGIWKTFLKRYSDSFAICRFGDDLGFKSSMLLSPATIRQHILPQYARIIDLVHEHEKPFLWHSCGNIFPIMDDVIALGIQAKHSNEDVIAPYMKWISSYSDRIALLGGIDLDVLCTNKPDDVFQIVLERARENRLMARGYALGSGNSIPEYVPVEGYLAMVRAVQALRLEPI